jgi:glycosyltransferase involved in cell wall biosynthesis
MISVCTTVKNRSRVVVGNSELRLFQRCVESIVGSVDDSMHCELVVSDWKSDDWPLQEWLYDAAKPLPVRIVSLHGRFSRGKGRNCAAEAAVGNVLFFLDADCLISPDLLQEGLGHVQSGKAFFPITYSFNDPEHQSGIWRIYGYGNCMLARAHFESSGGWPEYSSWGREDNDFFDRVRAIAKVVRKEVPGFYHQWHPHEIEWKDRLVDKAAPASSLPILGEEDEGPLGLIS